MYEVGLFVPLPLPSRVLWIRGMGDLRSTICVCFVFVFVYVFVLIKVGLVLEGC